MFNSARHNMPPVEYVSTVSSVFKDRVALLFGALASALAAGVSAYRTDLAVLYAVVFFFIIVGLARFMLMGAFWKNGIEADDVETAAKWELRATWGGVAVATVYGLWCYVALVHADDAFSEVAATSLSIAAMVGVVGRNFGLDRLVTLQSGILTVFLTAGFIMAGDSYYLILAVLLVMMLVSFRKLAADAREVLLNAVNGRISASRLATELDTALTTMPHGLCLLDKAGRISVVNRQAQLGFFSNIPEFTVGRHFHDVLTRAQEAGFVSASTADYIAGELAQSGQSKLMLGLGDGRQWELTINSKSGYTVVMMEDITERVRAAERITHMARYDSLTGLANRAYFTEQVDGRLKELSVGHSSYPVMMMIVDLDDFKHVNDTLGHVIGDAVLVEAAERLRTLFGSSAIVSRFGGDEFMIFLTENVNEDDAQDIANSVLAALHVPFSPGKEVISLKASAGIAIADGISSGLEALLTRADLAVHQAKSEGKARYSLFHREMDVQYRHRQRLKADLADALGRGELYLLFQPIVNLKTGRITGCEALVRWRHTQLGVVPPMDFIPIAEETGLMSEISRFVIVEAARECASWPDDMTISVNLSAIDFRDADVEEMVNSALEISGLAPERLTVEITESAIIEELEGARRALTAIREKGGHVALDDFGTGYSSLSYLHMLPFTRLKIDRSFVVDVTTNERSQRLLANIARLSGDLDMSVTVEGIETTEQLEVIQKTADIDLVQGYLFGAPLPRAEIAALIEAMRGQPAGLEAIARAAKKA